jgi:hypothetical protein
MDTPEVYVSTDVEADGPIPGINSMLSFGSAAFLTDKTLAGTFSANLELLPGVVADPATMRWWKKHPEAWQACRVDPQPPEKAMSEYVRWLKGLPGRPVFVGYPATYDFMFVYWYLIRFAGESPFAHRGLDIRSYAMAALKTSFFQSGKEHMPADWFEEAAFPHTALEDAIEQGKLFCNILAWNTPGRLSYEGLRD